MSSVPSCVYLETRIGGEVLRYSLAGGETCRIGRGPHNTVVLSDDLSSRNHAIVHNSGSNVVYLTDLGSRNGTFVNGRHVSVPVALRPGDQINIGNHEFTFQHTSPVPAPEHPPVGTHTTHFHLSRMLITVLVMDIRDYTGLAQRIPSERLATVTSALFHQAGRVLQERGAWAQKYLGDAVMAIWLHPTSSTDAADFVNIFEALAMLVGISARMQLDFGLDTPIRLGAGINSGLAAIGNFGSTASSDYTALGDVVNKAFRLESATKEIRSDLAIGEDTYKMLQRFADISALAQPCTVRLKGYEEPGTAYGAHVCSLPEVLEALKQAQLQTA